MINNYAQLGVQSSIKGRHPPVWQNTLAPLVTLEIAQISRKKNRLNLD